MRKYYQAALFVIATVSLISLLFYRHEYNKLRYVLEVFNYFGKPNQKQVDTNCTNDNVMSKRFNVKFEEPASSWQRIDNDLYLYSAYSIQEGEIQVLGLSKVNSFLSLKCLIFFKDEYKPSYGNFKYIGINSSVYTTNEMGEQDYSGYRLTCTYSENKIPVGITFLTESSKVVNDLPILSIKVQPRNLNDSGIAACVMPPSQRPMHEFDMITFLSFHESIGINHFVVYDFGIPNTFNSKLKELSLTSDSYGKFTYTTLRWNFPFMKIRSNVIRSIIEADCLHRTYNKIKYVLTLSWEEYMIMKYHNLISDLLADYNLSKLLTARYSLNTLYFCVRPLGNIDSVNSTLIMFRKAQLDETATENNFTYISKPHEILRNNFYTQTMAKDLIVKSRYKYCDNINRDQEVKAFNLGIYRFTNRLESSFIFNKLATNLFPSNK